MPAAHVVHATQDGAWKPVADHVPAAQGCAGTHVRFAVMKLKPDEQKHVDWPVSVPATTLPVPAAGHCMHPSAVVVTVVEVVFEYVFAGQAVQVKAFVVAVKLEPATQGEQTRSDVVVPLTDT